PRKTFSTNIMGLVNVMEAAVKTGVKAVVVVSSDKCYLPAKTPRNIHSPLGGKEPYSASKAAAEMVLGAYRERMNIIVARAGNAIGGGDWAKDRLIPDLMRALASNSPIFIRNPHASRPWQHVCELVHAYLQMGLHAMRGHHCSAWNVGPDRSATVGDILDELRRTGLSPRVVSRTNSFPENQILQLDVRETEEVLGLRSVLSWKKALSWTIEEYACIHSSSFSELIWERFCSLGSSDTSSTDST
ncbi:MAG: NAD-dependent epimerase/dehydratase family protein, partial [Myxococcota bacterium]|nr:NAD-dependent epimerase/dehydratase family protein [Myxococcota bacterium]